MVSRPRFKDPRDPRNLIPPGGARGDYRVTFTFCRPDAPPTSARDHKSEEFIEGDSHLGISAPAVQFADGQPYNRMMITGGFENVTLEFEGIPNRKGFLGKCVTTLTADNFAQAEKVAFRCLAPLLSAWSLLRHVPLQVFQVDCVELATGAWRVSYRNDFFDAIPAAEPPGLDTEFQNYASLYREAMVANSEAYRYLCLFKIIESIYRRRSRLGTEAKLKGEPPLHRPEERVPDQPREFVPWLQGIFPDTVKWDELALDSIFLPEVVGQKVKPIFEKNLGPLRNAIAHAITGKSGELTVSIDQENALA